MSSESSDGATRLKPATSVQRVSDEGQVITADSGNPNHTSQTDHNFQIPITNIDDILCDMSHCSDIIKFTKSPCKSCPELNPYEKDCVEVTMQFSPQECSNFDTGSEKGAILPVGTFLNSSSTHVTQQKDNRSAVLNRSCSESPDAGYRCMYSIGDDTNSNSDSITESSLKFSKMASSGGSSHEHSSDEEEVDFCLFDAQQPADGGHSHLSQPENKSSPFQCEKLDQTFNVLQSPSDVCLLNRENSFRTPQSLQSLGVSSTEEPCKSSKSTITVSSIECHINSINEPFDKLEACLTSNARSLGICSTPSSPDTHSVSYGNTAKLHTDTSLTSDLLKLLKTQTANLASLKSENSGSSIHGSDTTVLASMIMKEKVLECTTNLNPHANPLLKASDLNLLDKSDCPVAESNFKLQDETQLRPNTSAPKLRGKSFQRENKVQEQVPQKPTRSKSPVSSKTMVYLNQPTNVPSTATMSSFLKTSNEPKVSERKKDSTEHWPSGDTLQTVQLAKEKNIHLGSKTLPKSQGQSHPPAMQRTFIEVRLFSLPGSSSPVNACNGTVNSKDSKCIQRSTDARLTPLLSPANSTVEKTSGIVNKTVFNSLCPTKETKITTSNSSKANTIVETSGTLTSSTSRLYIKTMERQSFSTDTALSVDYNTFSVRHKIKSFENLANFDKPVAKNSDSQLYTLAYRASINHRISGYMGLVNTTDWTQRRSVENLIPTTPCSPPLSKSPSSITLINLELPNASCNTAVLTLDNGETDIKKASDGFASQTPPVLRRKHARLHNSRLRQLRALSMPELEKLCTEDFSKHDNAIDETEPGIHHTTSTTTVTGIVPPSTTLDINRMSPGDSGSTEDTLQGTPETHRQQPGFSIRWVVQ